MQLRRPADYASDADARFEISLTKARGIFGNDAQPFEVRYEERNGAAVWTRTEITDADLMRVADALNDGMSIREAATELDMSKSKVERLKKKAADKGLIDG
jgi:putative DNA primase/helicase